MTAGRLFLVDASGYVFRAFHALPPLSTSKGEPIGAVYGYTSMLLKLLREEAPDRIAVVFDHARRTFRQAIYPEYKAHRPPPPPELVPQFALVREVTRVLALPMFEVDGFEADDVIGTLATAARARGYQTTIVSSDKDLMQLVGPDCVLYDTMRDARYDPAGVQDKLGVRPDQVVDWLALMGDASDNIPGVPGIGKKTAADLLQAHQTLEGVYRDIDRLTGKRRESLLEHRGAAFLSQKLATIRTDVELELDLDALVVGNPDPAEVGALLARLEFKNLKLPLPGLAPPSREAEPAEGPPELAFEVARDATALAAHARRLHAGSPPAPLALIVLRGEGHPVSATLLGVALAAPDLAPVYIPAGHRTLDSVGAPRLAEIREAIGPLLTDPARQKLAHALKDDLQVLGREGLPLEGPFFDVQLASYLLDADRHRHGVEELGPERLGRAVPTLSSRLGSGKKRVAADDLTVDAAASVACAQASAVLSLAAGLVSDLAARDLGLLHDQIEIPLSRVLARVESHGVLLDTRRLAQVSTELGGRAAGLEAECHALAGETFTLGSPKQLAAILFDKLGLETGKKTKTGYSTDSSVLELLDHPLPAKILEWRTVTKLKSTYTDALPGLVDRRTGRLHTRYQQAVAATGRLSSIDPNLQNIPVRSAEGRRIREAFVAPPGALLLSADYSQIELRVLAHLCESPEMVRAFQEGADIHARTAAELLGVPEAEVTRAQRGMAKTINFGVLYGMSAFRLAREQGISRHQAQGFIDAYFARFPQILAWKQATLAEARRTGIVRTICGRIRHVRDLTSKNWNARAAAERIAINTPVQGSAADIIKLAMIRIQDRLDRELPEAKMLLTVHDELVFEVPEAKVEVLARLVTQGMREVISLRAPIEVQAGWGRTWLEAH
jgi:DNA polymerase-1